MLALNSGIATYDGVVWSVTVTQQAITSMVIPLAIVLARPWELVAAETRIGRFVAPRVLQPGRGGAGGYAGWTALCLLTPVALWSVSSHGVLMLARVGDIAVGHSAFRASAASAAHDSGPSRRGRRPRLRC